MSAAEQLVDEVQELAPAPLIVLGRTLRYMPDADVPWPRLFLLIGPLDVSAFIYPDGRCTLTASANGVTCRVGHRDGVEDAEHAWLELASLEAPRLCALVVDGMAPREVAP